MKALTLLEAFADQPEATSAQIAQRFAMPRITAYGLLETLVAAGYLFRDGRRDVYRATNRALVLTRNFNLVTLTATVAAPTMREITQEQLWPAEFMVRSGIHMLIVETSDRHSPVSIARLRRRESIPMDGCAAGYAHLAFCSDRDRTAIINDIAAASGDPDAFDAAYITNYMALIRKKGFSRINFRPSNEKSIAAPVFVEHVLVGVLQIRYVSSAPVQWDDMGRQLAIEAQAIGRRVDRIQRDFLAAG